MTSFYPGTPSVPEPASVGFPLLRCWAGAGRQQGCPRARAAPVGCMGRGMEEAGAGSSACRLGLNDLICRKKTRPTRMHCSNPGLRWLPELELAPPQFPVDVICYFAAAVFTTVELSRVIGAETGQPQQLPMRERGATFPVSPCSPPLLLATSRTPGSWGRRARGSA